MALHQNGTKVDKRLGQMFQMQEFKSKTVKIKSE